MGGGMTMRRVGAIISVAVLLFGWLGYMMMLFLYAAAGNLFINRGSDDFGRYTDQRSHNSVDRIVVDSAGNIYYLLSQHNSFQVYDNRGSFLYRASFPAFRGPPDFVIDNDDVVFVIRGEFLMHLYKNGEYLHTDRDGGGSAHAIREARNKKEYHDRDGNKYVVSGRSVNIYDEHGTFMRKVSPKAPIWPFSLQLYACITILGAFLTFISNRKFFVRFFTRKKRRT
jgi:hypothetical protein